MRQKCLTMAYPFPECAMSRVSTCRRSGAQQVVDHLRDCRFVTELLLRELYIQSSDCRCARTMRQSQRWRARLSGQKWPVWRKKVLPRCGAWRRRSAASCASRSRPTARSPRWAARHYVL